MLLSMSPIKLKLREWRLRRGLTQASLAERAGIRQATVSDLERKGAAGELQRIDTAVLEALCKVLRVQPGDLIVKSGK